MMTGNFLQHCKRLIIILLLLFFSSSLSFSQTILSGNLNQPSSHVSAIGTGTVTVDDVSGFAANDFVLLIQMQGVEIYTNLANYGVLVRKKGEPGLHEFMKVLAVDTDLKTITFWSDFKNTYNILGNLQVVRVPYYNSATVTGTLTSNPWNPVSKSGGVLSMIVGRSIKLLANIDMSGKGFSGGSNSTGTGICQSTDPVAYKKDFYDMSDANSGYKGEGASNYALSIVSLDDPVSPGYMKGQGPSFNGGGGGNGRYSGGGGGANIGIGGKGGKEDLSCSSQGFGGSGGQTIDPLSLPNTIFPGGGGGSSTSALAGGSGSGGNGGGIVIIVTDTIIGKGGNIISNGSNGGNATGLAGAGGGGGGGTIALSTNSYGPVSDPIKFYVKGGNGGNSDAATGGEGGGGGGGLVWVSTAFTSNAVAVSTEGLRGTPGSPLNNPAFPGNNKPGFIAVLNGFLYNSIWSSVTGESIDSICSNITAPKLTGTNPFGGTPDYTIKWQHSTTSESTGFTDILGETSLDYNPGLLVQTTWFKRIVTDNSTTPIVDQSKPVKIIVHTKISGNLFGSDPNQIICWNQNPAILIPDLGLLNGSYMSDGITHYYLYKWHQNTTDAGWDSSPVADGNATQPTYDPPALTSPTFYKRVVTSGRCIDYGPTVKITVLDTIENNKILNSPPDICFGSTFDDLTATTAPALAGGDNIYLFRWEQKINDAIDWTLATGVNDGPDYTPTMLPQRIPSNQYIFRRIVYSGSNNVCQSVSNSVLLKDFPVITNNTISPVPAICSGSKPADIIGSPGLSGGDTNYTYSWEDSTKFHQWTPIPGVSSAEFPGINLTDTTSYRRIVYAVCSNKSKSIQVIVHEPILNNIIALPTGGVTQTICNNQVPISFLGTPATGGTNIPGDYAYMWKYSTDNSVFTSIPSGGTGINYSPPALTSTTYYKREVTSGKCTVISDPLTVTVLPDITNNTISGIPMVCYSLIPGSITGATLSGGSGVYKYLWEQSTDRGVNWSPAASTNNSSDYQPPALTIATTYRRNVSSGLSDCCKSVSNNFDIGINPLPVSPINAGRDTTIYSVEKLYHMKAIDPALSGTGETGTWALIDGNTSTVDDTSKFNTVVRNLSVGPNSFLWTVHRGPCKLQDSVDIYLNQDFIPQGFSPNGDKKNDTFVIEGLSPDDQHVDVRFVNGAGSEVYSFSGEGENLREWKGWDGKNSAGLDLPEGTYYYMLKITGKSGQVFKRSGFVVLKRY